MVVWVELVLALLRYILAGLVCLYRMSCFEFCSGRHVGSSYVIFLSGKLHFVPLGWGQAGLAGRC